MLGCSPISGAPVAAPMRGPVLDHKPIDGSRFVVHEFTALMADTRIVNIRKGPLFGKDQ